VGHYTLQIRYFENFVAVNGKLVPANPKQVYQKMSVWMCNEDFNRKACPAA
ncbi:hypothetical protein CSKR_107424, partial [Clonorchis sinensis]